MIDIDAGLNEEAIRRAERLKMFLADEVVVTAFENIERDAFEQWRSCTVPEARERLWARCSAVDELRGAFRAIVDSGVRAAEGTGTPLDPRRD